MEQNSPNQEFGWWLKLRCARKGLTARELGTVSSVSPSHIGRIERGERLPSASILKKLAKPLGISEIELLKKVGYLEQDKYDEQITLLKVELKREVEEFCHCLLAKIDRS